MNRYHLMMFFAIILTSVLLPLYIKAQRINTLAEEKNEIKRNVEFATLSATYALKDNIGTRSYLDNILNDYFNALTISAGISRAEAYAYTPVFVVLEDAGFYLCYMSSSGYYIPTLDKLLPYERPDVSAGDPKMRVTLSGEQFKDGVYDGTVKEPDVVRSYVQMSVEKAVTDKINELNDIMELPDFAYELPTEVIVSPDVSVLIVFQGYPTTIDGKYFDCVVQSSGQIAKGRPAGSTPTPTNTATPTPTPTPKNVSVRMDNALCQFVSDKR